VQTEAVLDIVLQTEEPMCVKEVHKPKQALGCVVGWPIDSEVKKTKKMCVILGVEQKPGRGKTTKTKWSGKTKKK
jgi:hypothetical protein